MSSKMAKVSKVARVVADLAENIESGEFQIDPRDFVSAKSEGDSAGTQISQMMVSLADAAQVLNRSFPRQQPGGEFTNVISPVVMPKDHRSWLWVFQAGAAAIFGAFGLASSSVVASFLPGVGAISNPLLNPLFGPHYWLIWIGYIVYSIWKNSYVMIPDGCKALITRYQKVEEVVGPGRKYLFHPMKRVGYVVNVTKEYPYNAPIRKAPTQDRVDASVDLFLQFRIEEPSEFIFTLGGVNGFSEKLHNAISEVTRALIYEQRADAIYDLVGENTASLLEALNKQFLPAVRFVNANITNAEPSSQQYRIDLAAAEMIKVAKEAYTYEYELNLKKEQDEGDLNKELAELREKLSDIRAEVATSQAQIDTAHEKAVNRANAYARQLMIEAESEANANAALLQAQALDIKAVNSARYPEILEYRFQQQILDKLEAIAPKMPQIINIGPEADKDIDLMRVARQMLGFTEEQLYSPEDLKAIQRQMKQIVARIRERASQIDEVITEEILPAEVGG